jgi:RNA polymerase sigma factor (sigma-70 family)
MRGRNSRWEPLARSDRHSIDLEALLGTLPADNREIIERHYLLDESPADIAAALGVSVRTIQRRIKRPIATLQEKFKNL